MKKQFIKARDGYNLELHIFEVPNAKAVVQVIHGMEEHQGRYEKFIKFELFINFILYIFHFLCIIESKKNDILCRSV